MKKYTLEEVRKFKAPDQYSPLDCPSGDYSEIKGRYPYFAKWGDGSIFRENTRFGHGNSFGNGCSFRQGSRFMAHTHFDDDCNFEAFCRFDILCSFGKGCSFAALDFGLSRAWLGDVSDELCLELMRRNASMYPLHMNGGEAEERLPNPWEAPVARTHFFNNKPELWKPGQPILTDYDLLMLIFHEKGWKYEPIGK